MKSGKPIVTPTRTGACALAVLCLGVLGVGDAQANDIPLGAASAYSVLFTNTSNDNLVITDVTLNGNVGVSGNGNVNDKGPSTISGTVDFSAAYDSKQFINGNNKNTFAGGISNYTPNNNVAAVASAATTLTNLSSSFLNVTGAALALNGNVTVDESTGTARTVNGVTYTVFNITSYSQANGGIVTIVGDGTNNPIVFNFTGSSFDTENVNLKGTINLYGLTSDQVLWNFTGTGTINLDTNASKGAGNFEGILLAPNAKISVTNANLDGRVFGGANGGMQLGSGTTINPAAPTKIPEPGTLVLALAACLGLWTISRRNRRSGPVRVSLLG